MSTKNVSINSGCCEISFIMWKIYIKWTSILNWWIKMKIRNFWKDIYKTSIKFFQKHVARPTVFQCNSPWKNTSEKHIFFSDSGKKCQTDKGEHCIFPFIRKGKKYYHCIPTWRNQFFCATSLKVDTMDSWGYCDMNTCEEPPQNATGNACSIG